MRWSIEGGTGRRRGGDGRTDSGGQPTGVVVAAAAVAHPGGGKQGGGQVERATLSAAGDVLAHAEVNRQREPRY